MSGLLVSWLATCHGTGTHGLGCTRLPVHFLVVHVETSHIHVAVPSELLTQLLLATVYRIVISGLKMGVLSLVSIELIVDVTAEVIVTLRGVGLTEACGLVHKLVLALLLILIVRLHLILALRLPGFICLSQLSCILAAI